MSGVVVIPAIDILAGRCVRLTQGDYKHPTVYSDDPVEMAAKFIAAGAQRLHVVDLDAARGSGHNRSVIRRLLEVGDLGLQVAGGVRSMEAVDSLIDHGAHWVIMGTAAVKDPRLFESCARRHPGRVLAALDIRDNKAAVGGWMDTAPVVVGSLVGRWDKLPLAGIILTCIDRDGTMSGPDLATLTKVRKMTGHELGYSGGIASIDDIAHAAEAGAQAVILGKAIYEGRISLREALATT